MADEQDGKVTAAYRALGAEEPPAALDQAILAASRRPAKTWTQRWAVPLSLAAVLVLSLTVTLRIHDEAPELQSIAPAPPPAAAPQPEKEQVAPLKLKAETQIKAAKPAARAEPKAFSDVRRDQAPAVAASAPTAPPVPSEMGSLAGGAIAGRTRPENDSMRLESSVSGPAARQAEERVSRDAEAVARTPQAGAALAKRNMAAADAAPAPERELERIAALRKEGKHDEADKALAEFRKRNPDFRISEDWLKRVERR